MPEPGDIPIPVPSPDAPEPPDEPLFKSHPVWGHFHEEVVKRQLNPVKFRDQLAGLYNLVPNRYGAQAITLVLRNAYVMMVELSNLVTLSSQKKALKTTGWSLQATGLKNRLEFYGDNTCMREGSCPGFDEEMKDAHADIWVAAQILNGVYKEPGTLTPEEEIKFLGPPDAFLVATLWNQLLEIVDLNDLLPRTWDIGLFVHFWDADWIEQRPGSWDPAMALVGEWFTTAFGQMGESAPGEDPTMMEEAREALREAADKIADLFQKAGTAIFRAFAVTVGVGLGIWGLSKVYRGRRKRLTA